MSDELEVEIQGLLQDIPNYSLSLELVRSVIHSALEGEAREEWNQLSKEEKEKLILQYYEEPYEPPKGRKPDSRFPRSQKAGFNYPGRKVDPQSYKTQFPARVPLLQPAPSDRDWLTEEQGQSRKVQFPAKVVLPLEEGVTFMEARNKAVAQLLEKGFIREARELLAKDLEEDPQLSMVWKALQDIEATFRGTMQAIRANPSFSKEDYIALADMRAKIRKMIDSYVQ